MPQEQIPTLNGVWAQSWQMRSHYKQNRKDGESNEIPHVYSISFVEKGHHINLYIPSTICKLQHLVHD